MGGFKKKFWFGDENATISGFCQTAARRMAVVLPIAVTFSSSATIALTYLMSFLWLFGGHWRERYALVRSSGILLASIPLILWTGVGILRYENSLGESVRYWFGHYPYIFILILATLLTKKEYRCAILSSVNLAVFLCCLWAIGFYWYYQDLSYNQFYDLRIHSIYLYRNTICFGVALTLWGGLWACLPYTSRHIGWVRRLLPRSFVDAMDVAASLSPYDLLRSGMPFVSPERRISSLAAFLALLRWGIVLSLMIYLFVGNSSRTAQLAVLAGYSSLLILWNRKKGLAAIFMFLIPVAFLAGSLSDKFPKKLNRTIVDIKGTVQSLWKVKDLESINRKNRDRLGIHLSLLPDLLEHPLIGQGMEKARRITKEKTNHIDPHNEFVYMMLQHGFIGLGCFLFWILATFVRFRHLSLPWNRFGLFLIVIVTIDCLFNNAMSYHRETFLLCIGFALLASMEYQAVQDDFNKAHPPLRIDGHFE